MSPRACVGCGSTTRKLPHPGPRCAACHRSVKQSRSDAAHGARILATYGITSEDYQALYEAAGGHCALCLRATGKTKRLAVDHDHRLEGRESVRGLLCGPCNQMLGRGRDDPEFFLRAAVYLVHPPAHRVLGTGPATR